MSSASGPAIGDVYCVRGVDGRCFSGTIDDSLVPGQIVAGIMHLPHVTEREDRAYHRVGTRASAAARRVKQRARHVVEIYHFSSNSPLT